MIAIQKKKRKISSMRTNVIFGIFLAQKNIEIEKNTVSK